MLINQLLNIRVSRVAVLCFTTIFLVSCGSVPLSSMYKMASMDKDDIRLIDPRQIRTRITVDSPTQLQTRDVKLALRFEFAGDDESEYKFLLEFLEDKTLQEKSGWFSEPTLKSQYEFKLAESSIGMFKRYQREFIKYGKPNKYYWTVYYYFKKRPPENQNAKLDLELKMAVNEDYFYLLKDAELAVD